MRPLPELEHTHDHGQVLGELLFPYWEGKRAPIAGGQPISLADLDARFKQHRVGPADVSMGKPMPDGTTQWGGWDTDWLVKVDTLAEAHGIWFDCPLCYRANGGPVGTHGVLIWFPGKGVPDRLGQNSAGKPVRWNIVGGTGINDLQLSPSIQLQGGCNWHGFVGNSGIPAGYAG